MQGPPIIQAGHLKTQVTVLPPPPTPFKSESEHPRLKNIFSSRQDASIIDSIAEKLTQFKENPLKVIKKVLRFEDAVNTVGPGYPCDFCEKTFLQRHDCLIHQLSVCIPGKGVRKTTKKNPGPIGNSEPPANVQPVDHPVHITHRASKQASDQRESVENKVELIWEAKTVNTTDHASRLQSLSDENQ